MIIKKIFNNNSILAKDCNNNEVILMGCGIAFSKKSGDYIDENTVEKVFTLKEKEASEKFKVLLEDIDPEHVSICYDIIEYFKNMLDVELNDYIYVTLTDHISNTINLFKEGINKPNLLVWEIKKFYQKEYNLSLKALELIEDELGYQLPEDEAGNIALHLINAQVNNSISKVDDLYDMTKKIGDILNIIKYTYNITIDEKSMNYLRFVTHLRFFFNRLNNKELINEEDDFLLNQVKEKHKDAYDCMLKIQKYLEVDLSNDEKLYLTLHIKRVTSR